LHSGDLTEPMGLFDRPGAAADYHQQTQFEPEASP
jgi:hypothetical protein